MSSTVEDATEMRPFPVAMPDEPIADFWRRIATMRLPGKELIDTCAFDKLLMPSVSASFTACRVDTPSR
jgi:hypothetical protein